MAQYAVRRDPVLFYAEPTRTYDLDVFVTLEAVGKLAPLSRVYEWDERVRPEAEHLLIAFP